MSSIRPNTARAAVYAYLAEAPEPLPRAEVISGLSRSGFSDANLSQALVSGAKSGELVRLGDAMPYRYTLSESGRALLGLAPPPGAKDEAHNVNQGLTASLGTRCGVVPENRSQGTIAQALRAVLHDQPQTLEEIFLALPIGWSRAEAVGGLQEAVLAGWVTHDRDGWALVAEPPADAIEPAEDPLSVDRIPNYQRERAVELRSDLTALLADALRAHRPAPVLSAIAQASEHMHRAVALLSD